MISTQPLQQGRHQCISLPLPAGGCWFPLTRLKSAGCDLGRIAVMMNLPNVLLQNQTKGTE